MRSLIPFFGNWKKCPDFVKKNALIVVIYVLNFSFKVQFLKASMIKKESFPASSFFCRVVDCLLKCPNSKNTPLP